jgi:radical SAM protein with 4Fe4S-binding SPASM domain
MKNKIIKYLELYQDSYKVSFRGRKVSLGKFFMLLSQLANESGTYLKTPARVQWEVTRKCNLRCKQCYINSNQNLKKEELTLNDCKKIIQEIKKNNVLWVELQGGEPFVRKDILQIIKLLKEKDIALNILSNGTLINDIVAQKLSEIINHRTDSIQISLDGSTREINDRIRGEGSFEKIIQGIKNCIKHNIKVSVNTTLMDSNISDLSNIYKKLINLKGVSRYTFFTLMKVGRGKNLNFDKLELGLSEAIKIKKIKKKMNGPTVRGFLGYIEHLDDYPAAAKKVFGDKFVFYNRNTAGISSIDIDEAGDVYPSSYLQEKRLRAGNIKRRNLLSYWRTGKWDLLRKSSTQIFGKCLICDRINYCSRGTRTMSYALNKCFMQTDPMCNYISKISTDRLILRPPVQSDFKFLKSMWENGGVMKFVGFPSGLYQSDEKIRQWINEWQDEDRLRLVIEEKKTKKAIGETGFHIDKEYPFAKKADAVAAPDIKLISEAQGKGFGSEALKALIDYVFSKTNVTVIQITPNVKNKAALGLYSKLGFKKVGKPRIDKIHPDVPVKYQYMEMRKSKER